MSERNLKVEDILPVKAVGIECMRESIPNTMSPHRYIYKWFARRPTAAARLAVLSTVLPQTVSDDELLQWMKIGPDHPELLDSSISQFITEKYLSWDDSNLSQTEHYGYGFSHSTSPKQEEIDKIQELVKDEWDGEVPTIIDPTAGGGTIPLESARYGFPTISNELNPVAWLLNKIILEYAPETGTLRSDIETHLDEILDLVEEEIEDFFPKRGGVAPSHYFRAYSITCPSCGERFPLTNRWWFNRRVGKAVRPVFKGDSIRYKVIDTDKITDDFDPSSGTVTGGDAECLHCGVVTERDDLVERFNDGAFQYEVCAVRYEKPIDGTEYHTLQEEDYDAIKKAEKEVENDLELATLLNSDRFEGHWDRAYPYGVTKWRDVYSPRQLLSHSAYLRAFRQIAPKIQSEYDDVRAESILVLLSFIGTKLINRNSRLEPINASRGCSGAMLGNNNFSFQWHFGENNMLAGSFSYQSEASNILKNYEALVDLVSHIDSENVEVIQGDAADLPCEDDSIGAVVMDPPYGDNIIYSEVADAFYVWLKEYLQDIFPTQFSAVETNKHDEAVENPSFKQNLEESEVSPRERYENKMSDIFSELYRVLEPEGALTVYFTDKETAAWDSLTMGLINSGFEVSATHTITSEMPHRVGMQGSASADSTLLLTCRKPPEGEEHRNRSPTLWTDIRSDTREAARKKATELLESDLNLTKTDTIISAFGPTLQVFTENYPVVDKHDELVRPKQALEEARTAVVEVLVDRELDESLDEVDNLTKWYILSWLVYGRETVPYDDARQLGLGVGVDVDEIKSDTKIWGKSGDKLTLKGQSYRVRDYTALEAGEKRRKRAYPLDPRGDTFEHSIDAVHAALNVIETKGSDFTWNWLNERSLQEQVEFRKTIKSLLQVLPEAYDDRETLVNLVSGETGELLNIDASVFNHTGNDNDNDLTTLSDF
ncbi:DUF1156 domain-containing protein [Haloferax volcanii]|uniref:DUF1156 domain-containing protein n=1 Tax=Haloferax volcanii TaxID=2246 RepID=UPI00349F1901